jgi:uncharacterized membrane protein YcaP (DUF421 family)
MDLWRVALRAVFAYAVLLVLVRVSGKRTVRQGSPFDFTVALIIGDMVDDLLWTESNASEFVIATGVLFMAHAALVTIRARMGSLS